MVLLFIPTLFASGRIAKDGARALLVSRAALVLSPLVGLAITVAMATGEVRYRIPFDVFFIVTVCAFAVGELRNHDRYAGASTKTPTTGR